MRSSMEGVETKEVHTLLGGFLRALMPACIIALLVSANCFASTIALQWDAETGVAGYKVYYNADSAVTPFNGTGATQGASPVNVANLTSATISGLDPLHAYYFAVTAYNSAGVESPYSTLVSVPEMTPPTTSITYPNNNATVSGTVSVTASATDNVGVTRVEFYINGVLQATDTASPYLFSWNTASLAAGTYTISSKAYDAAGNGGTSANVTVTIAANDTTPPAASLTSPVNNATVSGTVSVTANASDNVGVTKVEFYRDGTLMSASNVAPFSYSWNTSTVANGSHTLYAKAYDATGNVGQSATLTVTVNNPVADTTPPTVSISSPVAGATVSGTLAVSASASDNVGVSKVEFYVNGALASTSTASPYSYNWNTAAVANGAYTLSAKAYDAAGNVGQSSSVSVTVNNAVATTPISFVQVAAATPQSSTQAVAISYPSVQKAGDLNIIAVGWNDTTSSVQSVKDSLGNVYALAAAQITGPGQRQSIYYATGIKSGTNKVTVTFNQTAAYPDIRILEYAGVSTLDKTVSASGSSATSTNGSVTTTAAKELIFSANTVATGTNGAGTGFTKRIITSPDSDIAQDRIVASIGTYSASAPLTSSAGWVMQTVTFK